MHYKKNAFLLLFSKNIPYFVKPPMLEGQHLQEYVFDLMLKKTYVAKLEND